MGFCSCLYVSANVQLVQQQTLWACLCASFMPFASLFKLLPRQPVFSVGFRVIPPVTGLDTPLSSVISVFCVVPMDFQWLVSQLAPSQEPPHQLSVQGIEVWSAMTTVLHACPCHAGTWHGHKFNIQVSFVTVLFNHGFLLEQGECTATSRGNVE